MVQGHIGAVNVLRFIHQTLSPLFCQVVEVKALFAIHHQIVVRDHARFRRAGCAAAEVQGRNSVPTDRQIVSFVARPRFTRRALTFDAPVRGCIDPTPAHLRTPSLS